MEACFRKQHWTSGARSADNHAQWPQNNKTFFTFWMLNSFSHKKMLHAIKLMSKAAFLPPFATY